MRMHKQDGLCGSFTTRTGVKYNGVKDGEKSISWKTKMLAYTPSQTSSGAGLEC